MQGVVNAESWYAKKKFFFKFSWAPNCRLQIMTSSQSTQCGRWEGTILQWRNDKHHLNQWSRPHWQWLSHVESTYPWCNGTPMALDHGLPLKFLNPSQFMRKRTEKSQLRDSLFKKKKKNLTSTSQNIMITKTKKCLRNYHSHMPKETWQRSNVVPWVGSWAGKRTRG